MSTDQPNQQNLYCIGISYQKADEKIRGKYSLFSENIPQIIAIAKQNGIQHLFAVSTCNRTEIYALANDMQSVINTFSQATTQNKAELLEYAVMYQNFDAAKHLFRVGCGLESQIVGDFEIIGQMKVWFNLFQKQQSINTFLDRLFNTTLQISKRVKSETQLSTGATSVSYAAVSYILNQVENPSDKKILLFGTGKIGRNTCENLIKHTGHSHITLINRTLENATEMGRKFQVKVQDIAQLKEEINQSDIMIVATGANQPTVLKEHITTNKPLTIIDLSVPSNIESSVSELSHVQVLGVDELSKNVSKTIEKRWEEVPKAEKIIAELTHDFKAWLDTRKFAPQINAFRERLKTIHVIEHKALAKKDLIAEQENLLAEKIIQKLTNHLAHHLLENKDDAHETLAVINRVFKVEA